jgi:hypothetical protein
MNKIKLKYNIGDIVIYEDSPDKIWFRVESFDYESFIYHVNVVKSIINSLSGKNKMISRKYYIHTFEKQTYLDESFKLKKLVESL